MSHRLTATSRPRPVLGQAHAANSRESFVSGRRAYGLLCYALVTGILGAALSGCVVPLPYPDVEVDAAQSGYPPVIRSGNPRMGDKTTQIFRSDMAATFTLDVEDRDLDDTIYVRVYRDYDPADPKPQVANRQFPPGGQALRTLLLENIYNWCDVASVGQLFVFEVVAADRPFDDAMPGFRSVTPPGDFSVRPWIATCEE